METSFSSWVVFAVTIMIMTMLCIPINSMHYLQVTYADLNVLGPSCPPEDTCNREGYFRENINRCDCDLSCTVYNTCCMDSTFKNLTKSSRQKISLKCLNIYNSPEFQIFMVDSCKNDEAYDSLCYSNPEEANDPFLLVPVTSKVSGITYKNYFCAVCNEEVDSEQLLFWYIEISVTGTMLSNIFEPQFKFNKRIKSWTVHDGKDDKTSYNNPVTFEILSRSDVSVKYCEANIISNCARNWRDDRIAFMCRDYMAIVVNFQNVKYRNVHCALCNFENLRNLECAKPKSPSPGKIVYITGIGYYFPGRDNALIDIFKLEGRQRRCGRDMQYDKYSDKCRCNARIFKTVNGRCVHKV